MKMAFLGKGGSGKSTMATAFVKYLCGCGLNVLAIDADHNMDLSCNLGVDPKVFLGSDPDAIKEYVGLSRTHTFLEALQYGKNSGATFNFSQPDDFTAKNSFEISQCLRLMTAGPHTERVRSQEACSHSLAAPLKVYVPLLKLAKNQAVVIDERAGTDPVATGILNGVDLAVIIQENTVNSKRVAEQIKSELHLTGINHLIFDNKQHGVEADTNRLITEIVHAISAEAASRIRLNADYIGYQQ